MASSLRVVFDANVLISASLLAGSPPREVFDRVLRAGTILLSSEVLQEWNEVLSRPKFERYLSFELRSEFLAAMVRDAEIIDARTVVKACRDPRDDKYLQLAVDGRATHLITGDADLLALHPFQSIAILTPSDFLATVSPD